MKRRKIDLSDERRVLTWCIVSTDFLRQIIGAGHPQLFESPYSRTVAGWIWEYWETSKEAPGHNIQSVYAGRRGEIPEEDDLELIADFLQALSEDWAAVSQFNVPYAVQDALKYFRLRRLTDFRDRMDIFIEAGAVDEGVLLAQEFDDISKPLEAPVSLYRDTKALYEAFTQENDKLFAFPGQLGESLGGFIRGDFFAILGAMKRGKSWWLLYTAMHAVNMGFSAVFYSLEMVKPRVLRRTWQMIEGKPESSGEYVIPSFESHDEGTYQVKNESKKMVGVDPEEIAERQAFYRRNLRGPDLRVQTYPAYSVTVNDIEAHLDYLKVHDSFLPDVIVIDYADIIAPITTTKEHRHQLDEIWKRLRALAQDRHCLVVTGSQGTRNTLKGDANQWDVAEDIRKAAHVTKMVALNQTPEDKKHNVMRIKHLFERDGAQSMEEIVVLQQLGVARPHFGSKLASEVDLEYGKYGTHDEEEEEE